MVASRLPSIAGFRFAGIAAGIKKRGLDFGLIVADEPFPAAAMFTRNRVRAAPVEIAESRLKKSGRVQAILVNSGNANACTGKPGHRVAMELTADCARALSISPDLVLPASTGVIGVQLPRAKMRTAVPDLVAAAGTARASAFAEAILTTDQGPKTSVVRVKLGRRNGTVLGIAKGAGMIHPDMATTLVFLVTDVAAGRGILKRTLKQAVDASFHRITVDGDTSTNDAVMLTASGKLGNAPLKAETAAARSFQRAVTAVLVDLAKQIVADGEGAERVVRIDVTGAKNEPAATRMARTIATSQLVKTALHGADPNYGRILGALGRAGVAFDPDRVEIRIGDVVIYRRGLPVGQSAEAPAARVMAQSEYTITVRLAEGKARSYYYTCDLGHEYVRINADYRS